VRCRLPSLRAPHRPRGRDERGFALVAVLLVLALLGVVGAEFSYSMRLEASAARIYKEGILGAHLAEAAIAQATRELVANTPYVLMAEDGQLTFFTPDRVAAPRLERREVPLAGGHFSYRITDEEARLNLNASTPDRLDRLLQELGLEKRLRDEINDSIQDWRDANEEHRLNGAESEDYYLKLPVPYRSRNANLESVHELLQIRGITPALFHGSDERPGLVDLVTVRSPGQQININTASPLLLRATGLSDAEISEILQSRRDQPYPSVPPRFTRPALTHASRTFRIEAEGLVEGQVRARVTAIVQRRAEAGGHAVAVLEWSGIR
jgi:general secretion pathway protein K